MRKMQGTKRKNVQDSRRRSSLACQTCRRQKEKCEGGPPCWRCTRLGRPCQFPSSRTYSERTVSTIERHPPEENRVANLERIVRHFVGDVSMDEENLNKITDKVDKLPSSQPVLNISESFDVRFVSSNVAHYSGEFSHWNFSQKLRHLTSRRIERLSGDVRVSKKQRVAKSTDMMPVKEYWRPTQLQSSGHIVSETISQLPPRSVADFLVGLFFKYVQNNCFFVEEKWIKEKLDVCYEPMTLYAASDIAWVCAVFAVLGIGTQVAHMEDDRAGPDSDELSVCSEDSVGLSFYHIARRLLPDAITVASHESVQACLLLARFTLPLSTSGLSYTYFGLAIKMAVLNGMHRKYTGSDCDPRTVEIRNRLFWTAYTLEKRIGIMHGLPFSITQSEISANLPTEDLSFESPNSANLLAFIKVISSLGEVADTLKCAKSLGTEYSDRTLQLRTNIKQWWESLPTDVKCRDTRPSNPLFRQNVHLKLSYLLIYIYMGRPFILRDEEPSKPQAQELRSVLETDCVDCAFEIIETLQLLSDNTGLCRASYTEFSSCRAALLVLIAECLNTQQSKKLREALTRGMALIHKMTGGTSSESEISLIESLEAAIHQLSAAETEVPAMEASGYANFKNWTQSLKTNSTGRSVEPSTESSHTLAAEDFPSDMTDLFNTEWTIDGFDSDVFLLAQR